MLPVPTLAGFRTASAPMFFGAGFYHTCVRPSAYVQPAQVAHGVLRFTLSEERLGILGTLRCYADARAFW